MNSIDLTPLYRNSVGFDRLSTLINSALTNDAAASGYPPYNIEALADSRYAITLALAGFEESELDITVEKGVLTVRGDKSKAAQQRFLHQGIANRAFERKFNLADHVAVTSADLRNGLLTVSLVKEVPEAMKPRTIAISENGVALEHELSEKAA